MVLAQARPAATTFAGASAALRRDAAMRKVTLGLATLIAILAGLLPMTAAHAATHSITGRITVPAGFDVQQVTVVLDDQNGAVFTTSPDASGDYAFAQIPDGTYRVRAYGPDLSTETTAFFTLISGLRGKNLTLSELFTVSGSVSRSASSVPDGTVSFFTTCQDFQALTPRAQSPLTSGSYSVNVPAGSYRVLISSDIESWHSVAATCDEAAVVQVTGDTARSLSGLAPAKIKGRVTYKGVGLSDAFVSARRWDGGQWKPVAFAQTADDGTYTIANLVPGTFRVQFDSVQYGKGWLPGHYWPAAQTLQSATDIALGTGATVQGIDASMVEGASIAGTVFGPTGPRGGALVSLYDSSGFALAGVYTEPDGTWEITGLWPGSYKVSFEDADGSNKEYWNDKASLEQADTITVANLQDRSGLDAYLGGPDPCEFQKTCPAPPVASLLSQSLKSPPKSLKRGKRARLPATTAQGGRISWKSLTKKTCTVKKNRVRGVKKGKCVVRASSPQTSTFALLSARYTIRVR